MKKVIRVKGTEYTSFSSTMVKDGWEISDVPFQMRYDNLNTNLVLDNFPMIDDEEKVVLADKVFLLNKALANVTSDNLKHLNLLFEATLKDNNTSTDVIIIRHNRIFVVQFCYDLVTVTNHPELKENTVTYVLRQIEQTLKRYLPVDTVVKTFLFTISSDRENNVNSKRLGKEINDFFNRTTNRELLKIIM